ncbi:MAG: ATP-binding protein [Planctomycetota bacterium]
MREGDLQLSLGDLGVTPMRLGMAGLLTGLPAALAVTLMGGGYGIAAAALGATVLGFAGVTHVLARSTRDELLNPMDSACDALETLRRRGTADTIEERGAQAARHLIHQLNLLLTSAETRTQQTQAKLMSVEVAFERMLSVVESLSDGVAVINEAGELVLVNESTRRMLGGGDRSAVLGQPLTHLLAPALAEAVRSGVADIDRGVTEAVSYADLWHGKRVFDLTLVRNRRIEDSEFHVVVLLSDVTKDHELARLKDEFLSSVSHELRTPLTNIFVSAEILDGISPDEDSDEWTEFLGVLRNESLRLTKLVEDLLLHMQLETQQFGLMEKATNAAEVTAEAIKRFADAAAEKDLRISHDEDPSAPVVHSDPARILEILLKLVDNAVKFTPPGGEVEISVCPGRGEGVDILVADSGPGIPVDQRDTVFSKFCQLGDVLTAKPMGVGLGLPICRGLVELLGGRLKCEDSKLGGAQFRVSLPPHLPAAHQLAETSFGATLG